MRRPAARGEVRAAMGRWKSGPEWDSRSSGTRRGGAASSAGHMVFRRTSDDPLRARSGLARGAWIGALCALLRRDGRQLVRFALSGLASTGFYFVCTMAILGVTSIRADVASLLGYLAAIGFSYILQSRFTFRAKNDSARQMGAFAIVSLAGLALSWLLMAVLHLRWGVPVVWVAALICCAIPATNYCLFKWVVFAQKAEQSRTHSN